MGDFNSILLHSEKFSIRPPSSPSVKDFNDMVIATGLKDLGFRGNCFTWANNRQGLAYVAARLNRALSKSSWIDNFEDPIVTHLPRLSSDHSPLLLTHRLRPVAKNIPFKFEEMWLSYESFTAVVENSWAIPIQGNPQYILSHKLKSLKYKLKVWNKDVFGLLKRKIEEAEQSVLLA